MHKSPICKHISHGWSDQQVLGQDHDHAIHKGALGTHDAFLPHIPIVQPMESKSNTELSTPASKFH